MSDHTAFKELRIFVSSTFNDMRTERNVLLEKVFPLVAAHCHRKKAEFIGVDLRWGVSEEQSKRGETVTVCMNEIDHCRPLFMGMIGERYGWIPAGAEVSVTEQEILYGALEAPEDTEAFFYLRDSALTEELCGPFEPDPQQEDLRRRIRESGFPVMDGYRDLESFGRRVYEDLIGVVDRLIAEEKQVTPVEEARSDQLFLAKRYAASFVERPAEEERLRSLLRGGGLTILTGEPGTGKTTILARHALERIGNAEEAGYTFLYFTGSAADRGWEQLARQLIGELRQEFGLDLEETESRVNDREALRRAMYLALNMAAEKGPVCLVLDQLDTLPLEDGFGLSWLPEDLPRGVSVLVSANEGEVLSRLRDRPHHELRLGQLTAEEAGDMAERFLAVHSKMLSLKQLAMLRESERARNPLYLITLLNEIRHIGRHNLLTEQLREYLSCTDIQELFDKVLERLDRDYDEEKSDLPRRLFLLLEASRDGFTEGELIPLLGDVPQARFAPLRLALEPFTAVSGGALHVAVRAFRTAVLRHYSIEKEEITDCRRRASAWFLEHPDTPRRPFVLPWLLRETGEYEQLAAVLSEPACFEELWHRNRFETGEYWADLRTRGFSPAEGCREILDPAGGSGTGLLKDLAELFAGLGEASEAKRILDRITASAETGQEKTAGEDSVRADAFGLLGNLYQREGKFREAEYCYRQKYELSEKLGDLHEQQRAMGNLGLLALMREDPDSAEKAFENVLELASSLNQRDTMQIALGNLGNIAFSRKEYKKAEELFRRQKTISRDSGNIAGLINACGALGILYIKTGQIDAAERELTEQEKLSRRIGAADGLSNALGSLAAIAYGQGDKSRAEALFREKLKLCRQSGQFLGEQNALGNLASLAAERGSLPEARELAEERAALTRKNRAFRQYASALVQLASIEKALGQLPEAEAHMLEAAVLAKQHGFEPGS